MNTVPFKCGIVVLGCDKNTADAEHFAGLVDAHLAADSAFLCSEFPDISTPPCDALVIFSCAFISDAKEESIESILRWVEHREQYGYPKQIFVAGCLSQRYAAELASEIPEVDGWIGIHELDRLRDLLFKELSRKRSGEILQEEAARKRLEKKPYAFLKIGDGCDHSCSFCIIPAIKGRLYSRSREEILEEARVLLASGVKELDLVAQDCTAYGRDRYQDYRLPQLLTDLCALPGEFWIRCLYCYPAGISDTLLEVMNQEEKVLPYLDIPLQHISPGILKAMKRPAHAMDIPALISHIREKVPGITLRTTMLIGFPGELPSDHKALIGAMETLSFEWLGAFLYSPEEGTVAAGLEKQVGRRTMIHRYNQVLETQAFITEVFNMEREGRTVTVLVDGYDDERHCWVGRSAAEAPEVDGLIFIDSKEALTVGTFIQVRLVRTELYDMVGEAITAS